VFVDAMSTQMSPTRNIQAHATEPQSSLTSPTKTPRPVLGDLTPNVQLTPKIGNAGSKSPVKTVPTPSPMKAQNALQLSVELDTKENDDILVPGGSRKRPFSAIESPRRRDATRSPIKRQQAMKVETVSPAALRSLMPPPVMVELAEEDASSSDDGEDLEANASDEVQHIAGDLPVPTQGTTGSFSSLIDYNPDNASDRSEAASSPPTSARSGSAPVTSHVELLKLRLKMAMYKINTNQTLIPFSQLEVPHAREAVTAEDNEEQEEDLPTMSRQEKDSMQENIVITAGPIGKLGAGPVLAPTAFSARFIGGPNASESPQRQRLQHQMTPAGTPTRMRDERDLTSSVVKGHAASGLLELAHSK